MRRSLTVVVAVSVLLLIACTAVAPVTPTDVPAPAATSTQAPSPTSSPTAVPGGGIRQAPLGRPFTIRAREPVELATAYVVLSFEVIEDSRCPKDVTCVWAGQARVMLHAAAAAGNAPETATVTLGPDGKGTATLARRTITVSDLRPYPVSTAPIDPGAYTLTVLAQ